MAQRFSIQLLQDWWKKGFPLVLFPCPGPKRRLPASGVEATGVVPINNANVLREATQSQEQRYGPQKPVTSHGNTVVISRTRQDHRL